MRLMRPKRSHSDFPSHFQNCVAQNDKYARIVNLLPNIRSLSFEDVEGLRFRLENNHCTLAKVLKDHSELNDDAPEESSLKNHNSIEAKTSKDESELIDLRERFHLTSDKTMEDRTNDLHNGLRRGSVLLVTFYQPLEEYDLRKSEVDFETTRWLTVCGVVVRIGPNDEDSLIDGGTDPRQLLERAIIAAFCLPEVPKEVADELMRVVLTRAILEALCFEEVAQRDREDIGTSSPSFGTPSSGTPSSSRYSMGLSAGKWCLEQPSSSLDRDKRFMSIETSDLLICPLAVSQLVRGDMKFYMHFDRRFVSSDEDVESWKKYRIHHEERKRCACIKKCVSLMNSPSSSSASRRDQFYQYFTLEASRVKGLIDKWMPERPSQRVLEYFTKSLEPLKLNGVEDSKGSPRRTRRKRERTKSDMSRGGRAAVCPKDNHESDGDEWQVNKKRVNSILLDHHHHHQQRDIEFDTCSDSSEYFDEVDSNSLTDGSMPSSLKKGV